MSRDLIEELRSEIATLERFLGELKENDFIERMQIQQRLDSVRERLARIQAQPQPKSLPITFRGQPVEGTHSIDATFASLAIKAFVEATDTVASSLVADELKGRGRLPGVGPRALRIVDTAVGSFGFELELPPQEEEEHAQGELPLEGQEEDPYSEAIKTTLALLGEASADDEEAISDLVAEVHPRAAAKIRAFAKVLADNHALLNVEFDGKRVQFEREGQVHRVVESLKDEDIAEEEVTLEGVLLGVLPEERRFEARLADGSLRRGKVARSVENISTFKGDWENVNALLGFRVIRVRANQRFILIGAKPVPQAHPETPEPEAS